MPANKSSLWVYFMKIFHSDVVYQNYVFFTKIGNNYSLKIKKKIKLCIDYKSSKYILKIFLKKVRSVHHTS